MREVNFWKELVHKIESYVEGNAFEMVAVENNSELTRFARSYIHQNVAEKNLKLTIKVINDDKFGIVTMNDTDEDVLAYNIKRANDIAKISPKLDYHYELVKPQSYKIKDKYFEKTANFTPMDRAHLVKRLINEVDKEGYEAAGAFETGTQTIAVANSEGVFAFDRGTNVDFNCVITKGISTAYTAFVGSDIDTFDVKKIVGELLNTAGKNVDQIEIEPGIYTVILSPEAVAELLNYMAYAAFNGKSIVEGKSFVTNNIDKKLFPDTISVLDDPFDELTISIPFDFIGYPRRKQYLIENGTVRDGVYDHATALKYHKMATGNTLPPEESSFGAIPFNLVMENGDSHLMDMITNTKQGIYVSRFHYVNVLNPMSVQLTGMTRNGTFLIEEGKIAKAIKNMRFNTSVVDMLKAVDMISEERLAKPGFVAPVVAPYIRTKNFTFSSKTEF